MTSSYYLSLHEWKKRCCSELYPLYHRDKTQKCLFIAFIVTQCPVQSILVQLCFDSEKQRSFPTIKFTFIVIYTYIIIIIIIIIILTTQVRKVSIFPIPKKWQICCNQIIKAGENLFFFVLHNDQDWIYFPHLRIGKEVVIYDTLIHF